MAISGLSRQPQHTLIKGNATAGPCSCASARVGETVLAVVNITTAKTENSNFESTISVNGQIQQTAAGLQANEYWVVTIG